MQEIVPLPQPAFCRPPCSSGAPRPAARGVFVIYHRSQMDSPVRSLLASGARLTDAALERMLPSPETLPHSIHRAMRHSVFAGGKRLRPILCMEAARMVFNTGELPDGVENLGAAIEMLHTYCCARTTAALARDVAPLHPPRHAP